MLRSYLFLVKLVSSTNFRRNYDKLKITIFPFKCMVTFIKYSAVKEGSSMLALLGSVESEYLKSFPFGGATIAFLVEGGSQ